MNPLVYCLLAVVVFHSFPGTHAVPVKTKKPAADENVEELEPLKPVTCEKGYFSLSWTTCWKECGAQGGIPACCTFEGSVHTCQCQRSLGFKDFGSVSKVFSTFKETVGCATENLKSLGKSLVASQPAAEVATDEEDESAPEADE